MLSKPFAASVLVVLAAMLQLVQSPGALHAAGPGDDVGVIDAPALRRPMALALIESRGVLVTANRGSGSLSLVDVRDGNVAAELKLGTAICDVAAVPGGDHLLALDEAKHALHLVAFEKDGRLAPLAKHAVSSYPVSIRVSADGRRCYVASLWSRRLSLFDVNPAAAPADALKLAKVVDLPFAPREQLLIQEDSQLIVADAFRGKLAIIDAATGELLQVREVPAHNIRGLALTPDGKKVLLSHQILNDLAETTQNDVHWGVLMSNVLRWVVLDHLLDPAMEVLKDSHVHLAGDISSAGGDPNRLVVTSAGQAIVALGGVDEVGFGVEADYSLTRLPIGRRPTAVAASGDGSVAYVANCFDDSISVVDFKEGKVERTISLGSRPELTAEQRGEDLFYNAQLSMDGWFSCHSCHTDGHSNGLRTDNFGDGTFGAAKQVLSLLGAAETAPWAWTGNVEDLEQQTEKSIRTTMQGHPPNQQAINDLTAFVKTLAPPPSLAAARGDADQQAAARGQQVFERQNCQECHAPPTFTARGTFDVGLHDGTGNAEFNPPSLRGVSQREAFFHDGRAASLREVFEKHRHQVGDGLSDGDLADLLEFLRGI